MEVRLESIFGISFEESKEDKDLKIENTINVLKAINKTYKYIICEEFERKSIFRFDKEIIRDYFLCNFKPKRDKDNNNEWKILKYSDVEISGVCYFRTDYFNIDLSMVKPEDEEPTLIEDLIKRLEELKNEEI